MDTQEKITKDQFLQALETLNQYKKQLDESIVLAQKELDSLPRFLGVTHEMELGDTKLSVRLYNILRHYHGIRQIGDLKNLSKLEFIQTPFVGVKAIEELEELCLFANIEMMQ